MTEAVGCTECGEHYDSQENPFCPRCGSMRTEGPVPGAVDAARRRSPARRRVQAAGVALMVVGAFFVVGSIFVAVMVGQAPPQTLQEALAGQPGGALSIQVVAGGESVAAVVNLTGPEGAPLTNGTTDAAGWFNTTGLEAASVTVHVAADNGTWQRRALVMRGDEVTLRIDTATDAQESSWVGLDPFVRAVRIVAVFLAFLSLFIVAGGVAALRLRQRPLAVAGAMAGFLPLLVITVAAPMLGGLLLLAVVSGALVLILLGRHEFRG